MRIALSLLLAILLALPAAGLGVYGGANSYRLMGSDTQGLLADFQRGYDWTGGVFQDLDFGEHVALRGAFQVTSRNSWQESAGAVREDLNLRSYDFPLDLLLRNSRRHGAFVSLGAALHVPQKATYCEATRDRDTSICVEQDLLDEIVQREVTFSLGAGLEFGSGFLWLRYNMGLENIFRRNDEGLDYTSEVLSAVIGLRF
ncbi:hypothetical protein H8E52_04520 [bacterium]|nr:hypothetical protein [bacterium]